MVGLHLDVVVACGPLGFLARLSLHGVFDSSSRRSSAADFVHVARNLVTHGEVLALDAAPPCGLLDQAEFTVNGLSSNTALLNELSIFVRSSDSIGSLDQQDEERRAVSPKVLNRHDSMIPDNGQVPNKGYEDLVGDHRSTEGNQEHEAKGHCAHETHAAVDEASVPGLVVLDGVAKREADGQPCDDEHEPSDLEANACSCWDSFGGSLIWRALQLRKCPAPGDNHEEVLDEVSFCILLTGINERLTSQTQR